MKIIIDILAQHLQDGEVRAFGSRQNGTAKDYSDLDIAIVYHNKQAMDMNALAKIKEAFEESTLTFRVDVLDYWAIHSTFRTIIDSSYEVIYRAS